MIINQKLISNNLILTLNNKEEISYVRVIDFNYKKHMGSYVEEIFTLTQLNVWA